MDNLQDKNFNHINDDWTILSDISKKRFEIKKNKNIIDKSINDSISNIEDDLKFEQTQPRQIEEIDLIDIKNANALASINQDLINNKNIDTEVVENITNKEPLVIKKENVLESLNSVEIVKPVEKIKSIEDSIDNSIKTLESNKEEKSAIMSDYILTPIKNDNIFELLFKNSTNLIMYSLLFIVPLYVSYEIINIPSILSQLNKESFIMQLVYKVSFFSILLYTWYLFQSFIFGIEEITKKFKISIIKTN